MNDKKDIKRYIPAKRDGVKQADLVGQDIIITGVEFHDSDRYRNEDGSAKRYGIIYYYPADGDEEKDSGTALIGGTALVPELENRASEDFPFMVRIERVRTKRGTDLYVFTAPADESGPVDSDTPFVDAIPTDWKTSVHPPIEEQPIRAARRTRAEAAAHARAVLAEKRAQRRQS